MEKQLQLIIRGTVAEVQQIVERLAKDFPGKTIVEFLEGYSKDVMVLQ